MTKQNEQPVSGSKKINLPSQPPMPEKQSRPRRTPTVSVTMPDGSEYGYSYATAAKRISEHKRNG